MRDSFWLLSPSRNEPPASLANRKCHRQMSQRFLTMDQWSVHPQWWCDACFSEVFVAERGAWELRCVLQFSHFHRSDGICGLSVWSGLLLVLSRVLSPLLQPETTRSWLSVSTMPSRSIYLIYSPLTYVYRSSFARTLFLTWSVAAGFRSVSLTRYEKARCPAHLQSIFRGGPEYTGYLQNCRFFEIRYGSCSSTAPF